jgi:Rho-type GTPase-activating protein 1/2
MFGRDLVGQVRSDARGGARFVPVIVEKCIEAVEAIGELALGPLICVD